MSIRLIFIMIFFFSAYGLAQSSAPSKKNKKIQSVKKAVRKSPPKAEPVVEKKSEPMIEAVPVTTPATTEAKTESASPVNNADADEQYPESPQTSLPKKTFRQISAGGILWQESIKAKRDGDEAHMLTLFQGLDFGFSKNKYVRFVGGSEWRQVDTYNVGLGIAQAKGDALAIQDELKNQGWLQGTVSRSWIYRTSPVSEVGFITPASLRYTQWKLSDSELKIDRQFAVSAGVGGVYINRFAKGSSLRLSVVHQALWQATVWGLAWDYAFR